MIFHSADRRIHQLVWVAFLLVLGAVSGGESLAAANSLKSGHMAIRVDQVGYEPAMPKLAMVVTDEAVSSFTVERPDGTIVMRGEFGPAVLESDSGDRIRHADFSALTTAGRYVVAVPGVGKSFAFEIRDGVTSDALYLAVRSFYGQRCGTAVDLGPRFPGYAYPACHQQGGWHPSSGKTGPRASIKGWHDAGDYGRYIVNSGISTATLLWAWELFPDVFRNLSLDIPESGDDTPDLLDEIRWNLDWMLSMQDEDGGVWHKQTSLAFAPFVMPQDDRSLSHVIGVGEEPFKGSCATADFAAVTAIAARVMRPFDAAYARTCLAASRKAWAWAVENPEAFYRNPEDVSTGAYGDGDCGDERLWAATELWRTTGEEPFEGYFHKHAGLYRGAIRANKPLGWATLAPLAFWGYALTVTEEAEGGAEIREDILQAATALVERTASHGYRISLTEKDYVWGSNGVVANYGMQLLVAHALQKEGGFRRAALDNLHYLLGRNTFSLSWVTQVGDRAYRKPHHRPSAVDRLPEPWPGLLSGGPNQRRQDPAAKALPELPPAKMYIDDVASYGTNEIAINWNAALVFLLAGSVAD